MQQQQKALYQYFQLTESLEGSLQSLERLRMYLAQNRGPEFQAPAWQALLEEVLLTVLDLVEQDSIALMQETIQSNEPPRLRLIREQGLIATEGLEEQVIELARSESQELIDVPLLEAE